MASTSDWYRSNWPKVSHVKASFVRAHPQYSMEIRNLPDRSFSSGLPQIQCVQLEDKFGCSFGHCLFSQDDAF